MGIFIKEQEQYLQKKLHDCGYDVEEVTLNISSRPEFGDYQYNGIMSLAKKYHKNPREIAEELLILLKKDDLYKDVNIAGPGFINITFSDEQLVKHMNELLQNIEINYTGIEPKKIFFDYGGANVAKALHVGHLRSANIGEALKRLCKSLGCNVMADAHLGDWGRPIGLVMLEIKKRQPSLPYFDSTFTGKYPEKSPVTNADLMEIYPIASEKAKNDEIYMEEAREITAQFQNGDKGLTALWDQIMKVSKTDIKRIYDKLNTTFEIWEGESDGNRYVPELIEYLEEKNLIKESQGARIIEVQKNDDDHEIPPLLLVKSNNSTSYETTDLACIWERMKLHNPDEIWYLTDSRQALHFEQTFRAARISEIVKPETKLEFIPFGTMNGKDGKPFKTRDGGVMKLSDLLELVQKSSEKRLEESGVQFSEEEKKDSAYKIADATIKYADALSNRETDYIFDIDKFVETQGKTGPYILYSAVRINSLLKKALEQGIEPGKIQEPSKNEERMLMLTISRLPDIVDMAFENKSLTEIANYLYELNSAYNSFYNTTKVIGEQDKDKQKSWIQLSSMVGKINKKLLDTMAIEEPERM